MARLEVRGIDVRFGSVAALQGIDLDAPAGAVTGVVGPGGAGTTTLFNVVAGLQRPQAGTVLLDGVDVTGLPPHRRARLGIARTFRRLEIFGSLTVRENILVAAETRRRWSRDGTNTRRVTDEVLAEVGLRSLSRERCDTLPPGIARLVEVARALATQPSLLLLDEPSSGLDGDETDELAGLLGRLAQRDMAVLLFEHDADWAVPVCETVHLLGSGRILAAGAPSDVRPGPARSAAHAGSGGGLDRLAAGAVA